MAQVVVDDRLIDKARSLIEGETDETIVTAALEGWIAAKETQIDLEQYQSKLQRDLEVYKMSRNIVLDYYGEDFKVTIYLKPKNENNEEKTSLKTKDDPADFWEGGELEIDIDNVLFNKMYDVLFNVNIKDVLLGSHRDNDIDGGANIDLSFGGDFNQIHFELWGVNKQNMEKRNIKNICNVVKEILKIAGIDEARYANDL